MGFSKYITLGTMAGSTCFGLRVSVRKASLSTLKLMKWLSARSRSQYYIVCNIRIIMVTEVPFELEVSQRASKGCGTSQDFSGLLGEHQ